MKKVPNPVNNNGFVALVFTVNNKTIKLTGYGKFGDPLAIDSAKQYAQKLYNDYRTGNLRDDLEFYTPRWQKKQVKLSESNAEKSDAVSVSGLFADYLAYKLPNLAEQTQAKYENAAKHIVRLGLDGIGWNAIMVRQAIISKLKPFIAKLLCQYLQAMSGWAYQNGKLDKNYFEYLAADVPTGNGVPMPKPFTIAQRQAILNEFRGSKNYLHYANFVTFLFETGCRTCEAIGLQWKHVDLIGKRITLGRSISELGDGRKSIRPTSKNGKLRTFPMNTALLSMFGELCAGNPEDLVFAAPKGGILSSRLFRRRAWDKCLAAVGIDAKSYTPYSTRDTFITMALDKGVPVRVIAKLVDNSPEIIHKHYAGWYYTTINLSG